MIFKDVQYFVWVILQIIVCPKLLLTSPSIYQTLWAFISNTRKTLIQVSLIGIQICIVRVDDEQTDHQIAITAQFFGN